MYIYIYILSRLPCKEIPTWLVVFCNNQITLQSQIALYWEERESNNL